MRTITFYSYKGGVGRSLALANIATRLSEFGRQVCLLDFDLEAPGLHYKFATPIANNAKKIKKGLVDYIHQFTSCGILADSLREFSYSWFPFPQSCMTLIPAGDPDGESGEYWKQLSSINWYELLYENQNGLAFLLDLKEKIRRELNPDYLLVDSRTGISEMSGITLSLLADDVVVFSANNEENLEGSKRIIRSISDPDRMVLNKSPKVTFVLCRVPFTESPEDRAKEQNLITKIKRDFGIGDLTVIHSDRDLEEKEQIKIGYDKDESIVQISKDYLELFEKLTIKDLKPNEKENFRKIKDSEKYFQKAVAEIDPEEKLKWLNKAIELNKTNTEFYLSRAAIYSKRSEWNKVVDTCDEILNFETFNLRPYEIKGNALIKLKKIVEAKRAFEAVLSRDPNRPAGKLGLAQVAILENDIDKALHILNEVLARDPQDVSAYIQRANLKRSIGQSFAARDDIYQALNLQFDNGAALLTLAKIKVDINEKDDFYLNFENVLQLKDKLDLRIEEEIISDLVFRNFLTDQRFLKLLEKYNIQLTTDQENLIR
jgi:MinD-like ATPase involved in chromosome partitioning or flagellar assembly/thioredoxin-like negative regulator of GroEL